MKGLNKEDSDFTKGDFDALLKFLPIFERRGYKFYKEDEPDPFYYTLSKEASAFHHEWYECGFIFPFDWGSWDEPYTRNHELLERANLMELRKLGTAHMRRDRFVQNHLACVMQDGLFTAILRRLKEIRKERFGD